VSQTTKPLRVAQFVEALESGGAEALAIDIAGALANRGHESHLVFLRGGGPFRSRVSGSVRCHDLARPRQDGSQAGRIAYFFGTARRLELLLRSERIQVLQTHLPKANFLGLGMAYRGVCRVYPTVHNNREFDYGFRVSSLKMRLRRSAYRQMVRRCAAVIAVSAQVKASLASELGLTDSGVADVAVVPNAVPIAPPVSPAERQRIRAKWGLGDQEVLIAAAGRLTPQKNFEALVAALAEVGRSAPSWQCVVAGDGELRTALEQQIAGLDLGARIRLAGLVPDLPELMAAADLFCMTSRFEGLPLVLLEALAAGLPVVAFGIDGVADVVADGEQALLVAPGDIHALSSALSTVLADAALRRRLGRSARALAEEKYGFPGLVDRLELVYGLHGGVGAINGRNALC